MKLKLVTLSIALSASTIVLAQQAPVVDVGSSTSSIGDRVTRLEQMMQTRARAQNNLQMQIDDLQSEVSELRGVTEEHTYKLEQLLARQRELYQELDKRVNTALNSVPQQTPAVSTVSTPMVDANVTYSDDLSENEAYERAVNLVLKDRRYDAAIPEFRAFNKKYPDSSYAANSHYWLGQLLFYKAEFKEAESEFLLVVEHYKDSSKRPDALLKLGMVAQKLNQNVKAKEIYQRLISEYPESSAAKLATSRVASL